MPGYILLKGSKHGLANRLFVLSTAIRLCKETRAKLVIDWNDGTYGVPFWEAFALKDCESIIASNQDPCGLNGLGSAQTAWEGKYGSTVQDVYQEVTRKGEYTGIDLQEIPPISGLKTFFEGQQQRDVLVLSGYQKRGQSPIDLLRHFRVSESWRAQLLEDMSTQPEAIRKRSYVSLHVRAAAGDRFPRFEAERLVRYLEKRPGLGLFIATDLCSVEEEMRELFGKRLLKVNRTYAAAPAKKNNVEPLALHRISDTKMVESGRILYEALRDLWFLSRGQAFFAQPRSTFSEFACLFSECPPWRLHLSGTGSMKYRIGNWCRGLAKYRVSGKGFVD